MWKHVCDNANVRIWWIGYTYMVMWNVHAVKWRHRFENEKNMDLVMRICVIGNVRIRARWIGPYAWRSVREAFRGCTLSVLQSVRSVIGRPLAAVGADLSRPRIRKHIRNGEGKCVFGYGNMHFGNVRIRARWIGPYAWRSVRTLFRRWALSVCRIFCGFFVGVCGFFTVCTLVFCRVFAT